MSRVAKKPIKIPEGVSVFPDSDSVVISSYANSIIFPLPLGISIVSDGVNIKVSVDNNSVIAAGISKSKARELASLLILAGTTRALLNNAIIGLVVGYQRKLLLVGVGYKLQVKVNVVFLTVGHSHPVEYSLPDGVVASSSSATELTLKSADKRLLGQVASQIRSIRPPEPYKGKGIRYSDEKIIIKEAKKK